MKDMNKARIYLVLMLASLIAGCVVAIWVVMEMDAILDTEDHGASQFGILCAMLPLTFFWLIFFETLSTHLSNRLKKAVTRATGKEMKQEEIYSAPYIAISGYFVLIAFVFGGIFDPNMLGYGRLDVMAVSCIPMLVEALSMVLLAKIKFRRPI